MSPTIVTLRGRPILVVGGAGGPAIPMGVVEAISNVIDYGMDISTALAVARTTQPACAARPCPLMAEDARILDEVEDQLVTRGHAIVRADGANSTLAGRDFRRLLQLEYWGFPVLNAVAYDVSLRKYVASSDPRRECGAAAVTITGIKYQCPAI